MFGGGPLELRWCYNQLEYYNYSKEIIMNINREKVYEREREINVNKQTKKPKKKDSMSMKNLICLTLCYSKKLAILTGVFSK